MHTIYIFSKQITHQSTHTHKHTSSPSREVQLGVFVIIIVLIILLLLFVLGSGGSSLTLRSSAVVTVRNTVGALRGRSAKLPLLLLQLLLVFQHSLVQVLLLAAPRLLRHATATALWSLEVVVVAPHGLVDLPVLSRALAVWSREVVPRRGILSILLLLLLLQVSLVQQLLMQLRVVGLGVVHPLSAALLASLGALPLSV